MLRLLRAVQGKSELAQFGSLNAKRFTRFEPHEVQTGNEAVYTRFAATKPQYQQLEPSRIPQPNDISHCATRQATTAMSEPSRAPVDLSAQLYSEEAISVALLRRALPLRFLDIDTSESARDIDQKQSIAKFPFN